MSQCITARGIAIGDEMAQDHRGIHRTAISRRRRATDLAERAMTVAP